MQIQQRLDQAMRKTGMLVTEENYHKAGSVLAKATDVTGAAEMDILSCMINPRQSGGFAQLAAICTINLEVR